MADLAKAIINPDKFLGITDLRVGTIVLAAVNFIFILINFSLPGSWVWTYVLAIAIISLICSFFGFWGALKNNAEHVTWYFYYTFVNFIFAIINLVTSIIKFHLWNVLVNIFELIVSIYTVCVVKGYLNQLADGGAAGIV